jgi:hypothetical protein
MRRRAREAIAGFSTLEPSLDANGNVIVDSFEVMRQLFLNIAQRMLELPPPPPGPLQLGPGETEVTVRRRISRLRRLKTEVDDPVDGARIEAEKLETRAYLRREFLGLGYDMTTAVAMLTGEALLAVGGVVRDGIAKFNAVKQLPEAHDPENPLSVTVRSIHRIRKAMHGRPEKRKRKERKRARRR